MIGPVSPAAADDAAPELCRPSLDWAGYFRPMLTNWTVPSSNRAPIRQ
jgi:hypothetical protein